MQGRTLGRYELLERLGRGGMGEVWKARDPVLRRDVAVKVLRRSDVAPTREHTLKDEFVQRFLREARAAASLKHPNVVAIYDVGEDVEPFIVMEYVEGVSLRAFVGKAEPLVAQRIVWLEEIAAALAAAHEMGLVHRDIKPDNVMITREGHAKVLDFGVAKVFGQDDLEGNEAREDAAPQSFRTQQGKVVGTPRYMAPEQIEGGAIDGRVDQWAWACVAYELLTGTMPDRDEDAQLLSLSVPDVPFEVAAAVLRARATNPAKRYPDMNALIDALASSTDEMPARPRATVPPAEATSDMISATVAVAPKRARWRWALAPVALLAIAGGWWAVRQGLAVKVTQDHASPPAPRCAVTELAPTPLPIEVAMGNATPIDDGIFVDVLHYEADASRYRAQMLATITPTDVTTRPAPAAPYASTSPVDARALRLPTGPLYVNLFVDSTGTMVFGRSTSNDRPVFVTRLSVDLERMTGFHVNTATVDVMSDTIAVLATGLSGDLYAPHGALRLIGPGVTANVFETASSEAPRGASFKAHDGDLLVTFTHEGRLHALPLHWTPGHPDPLGRNPTGTLIAGAVQDIGATPTIAAILWLGDRFHVLWPQASPTGQTLHTVAFEPGDAGVPAVEDLGAVSTGAPPTIIAHKGRAIVAWRDETRVHVGEGVTPRAAVSDATAFAQRNLTYGPWVAPLEDGSQLVAWFSGAPTLLHRAVVRCGAPDASRP